ISALIILGNCFKVEASQPAYGQPGGPGGYPSVIVQMPLGSTLVSPVYDHSHRQSNQPYAQPSTITIIATPEARTNSQPQENSNNHGIADDIASSNYNNAQFLCKSFGHTITDDFFRTANKSKLFVLRFFNTHIGKYNETNNNNSKIIRFELFNDYKNGRTINNYSSSSYTLTIGNRVSWKNGTPVDLGNNPNSPSYEINISRNQLAALIMTAIALKTGAIPAALTAFKTAIPTFLVASSVGCKALLRPVAITAGGVIFVSALGSGFAIVIALTAGLSIGQALLAPIIIPLWIMQGIFKR